MTWRSKALRELRAGASVTLSTFDFADTAERASLSAGGLLSFGLPPETGEEVWIDSSEGGDWYDLVRDGDGYIGYPRARTATIRIKEHDARPIGVNRPALYRILADDLRCLSNVEKVVEGIWSVGTIQIPDQGRAKVCVVELGTSREALELVLRKSAFKILCVCFVDNVPAGFADIAASCGKIVVFGRLTVDSTGRFRSPATDELSGVKTPESIGARIDAVASPPLLVVANERIELPMDGARPSSGVLLLAYLFEHAREPLTCWELERAVFRDKRDAQTAPIGGDEMLDPRAEAQLRRSIKDQAAEIADMESDSSIPADEISAARHELERLTDAYRRSHAPGGKKKILGTTDSEKARQRVRKALGKVVDTVRGQSRNVASALEHSMGKGGHILFNPPAEWGL